jgi:hypothetical protein
MFSNGVLIFICSFFLFSFAAHSQDDAATAASSSGNSDIFYLCKRDKITRWLRAYKLENGKCKALYSKEGYLQVISSATFFASCEGVLLSVKKNLEEGNFKCTQMSKASVIDLDSN